MQLTTNYSTVLIHFQIESKVTLAIGGVMMVLISVLASIGILSYFKVATTLIIFEILPFLVLAVGVDNIFILVQRYQREPRKKYETHAEHMGRITGEVAPSMLLSSVSESTCFFLGALTDMPAVKAFALYAGMALLINFLMQITCFIALISLDMEREENNRYDVACCITAPKKLSDTEEAHESVLYKIFKYFYAPFLMNKWVRPTVIGIFITWLCFSLSTLHKVEIGLDQELSMPSDSFVLKYFQHLSKFLSVGPPVYFVVNNTALNIDFAEKDIQKRLCGKSDCYPYSLGNQIKLWSNQPDVTYIATGAQSWIDDYFGWMLASPTHCCQYNITYEEDLGTICQVNPPPEDPDKHIMKCPFKCNEWDRDDTATMANITRQDFRTLIDFFLDQDPGTTCALSGHAAYVDAIRKVPRPCEDTTTTTTSTISPISSTMSENSFFLSEENLKLKKCKDMPDDNGNMQSWCHNYNENLTQFDVTASNFMTYHTILRNSKDFYEALRWARRLADNLTEMLNSGLDENNEQKVNVFPYSIFYVFYEQYLTIWEDSVTALGISLGSILCVAFVIMGFDFRSSFIIVFVIWMILMDMVGMMYWWNVTLNAVSLVNLVMTIGISVEFCAHITRDFVYTVGEDKIKRAKSSLINVGSSVR